MEEQDSIRLQKKIILVLSIVLFLMSVAVSTVGTKNNVDMNKVASANIDLFSNNDTEESSNEEIEKVAYAALESIVLDENTDENGVEEIIETSELDANEIAESLAEREKKLAKAEVSRHESSRQQLVNQTENNSVTKNYASYKSLAGSNPPVEGEYTEVIEATATAYCLCYKCCGKTPSSPNYGGTASGYKIVPGTGAKVIAVDPKTIPLGTKVYVEGLNGAWDYGYATAADTGSAIKNTKIDLYMDTHSEALSWGVKKVKIYVLGNNASAVDEQVEEDSESEVKIEEEVSAEVTEIPSEEIENVENVENVESVESVENVENSVEAEILKKEEIEV